MKRGESFFYAFIISFALFGGFVSSVPKAYAASINTATNVNVTPGTYQYTTFKGVPVYRLHITNSGDASDTLVSLTPTPYTGDSVDDTLVTLHFYHDTNDNGIVDQGDTDLGASTNFLSDNTKQAFTFPVPLTVPVGLTSVLITADGGPAVGNAQIFHLSMALGTDILMGTNAITNTGDFPLVNTSPLTVSDTAPSLSITNGANDPGPKTATASETGVVVKQLSITAAATSDSVVSLAMTPAGSENDTNISAVKFYRDSGTTPGEIDVSDILLATTPTTYSTNNTIEIFTFLSPIIVNGNTTVTLLYTYDIGPGVIGGNTLTARLVSTTDAITGSGIVVSSNSSGVSSTITIANAANITVATAKVTTANTVLVTLSDPTENLSTVNFSKWHVDVGGGGGSPLTPTSASITSAGTPWTITLTFSGTPFSNTATSFSAAEGLYVDALGIGDAAGDTNVVVGNGASTEITDGQSPTILITDDTAGTANITSGNVTYTFTFSEPVTTFTIDDPSIVHGTKGLFSTLSSSIYTLVVTPEASFDGDVTVDVGASAAQDLATSANMSIASATSHQTVDTLRPTISIIFADTALKAGETSTMTYTFSEVPTGFTSDDVAIASGTTGAVSSTLDPLIFTSLFTPSVDTTDSTNIATVGTGWMDPSGNAPVGATDSLNYAVDTLRPLVDISLADYDLKIGDTSLVTFTFSEPVTSFTNDDVGMANGTFGGGVISADGGVTWTATFTPTNGIEDATNFMSVDVTGVLDAAANTGVGVAGSLNYSIDTVRPTVGIVLSDTSLRPGETATITFTFSEVPTGFSAEDVAIANGTMGVVASTVNPLIFTSLLTPTPETIDATNIATVGTGWVDPSGNTPSSSTDSLNYAVSTVIAYGGGGSTYQPPMLPLVPESASLVLKNDAAELPTAELPTAALPTAALPKPVVSDICATLVYDVYIINPDLSERHSNTPWVIVTDIGNRIKRYSFEDKTLDPTDPVFDHNDSVIDVDQTDCKNVKFIFVSSDAFWKHQVRIQVTISGVRQTDILVAENSKAVVGTIKIVDVIAGIVIPLGRVAPAPISLKGKILLQVQQHGEAWYIHPVTGLRYYMKDGSMAYEIMRNFGLGITEENLMVIPSADSVEQLRSSTSVCLLNRSIEALKGKILLQVQQHGEAWYVDPVKCRRVYLKDGAAAYSVMRYLGLGITDVDLVKIKIGS